jgi:transcriptional regulator
MYLPSHFDESRSEVLQQTLRSHPLGLLVTLGAGGLEANAIPFLLDAERGPHGTLRGHVARANPVWREARADVDAMVVFQGPQAYISPSWYATKAETGKVVPTWNYVLVQARGPLKVMDDPAWVRRLVGDLTTRHESPRAAPWKVEDAPADYIDSMLRAIVGIEIPLSSLIGKWKVSQNRPAADREGVVRGLSELSAADAHRMAEQVQTPGAA